MPKINVINFCKSWIVLVDLLRDVESQRKYWFNLEGPIVTTYEEATGMFLERYRDKVVSPDYEDLCNNECRDLLKQLYENVNNYELDEDRLLKYAEEEALLQDPKWLEIVALAQITCEALKRNIEEVKSGEK